MEYCEECKHTEANHPFYDGVGKIKCKEFKLRRRIIREGILGELFA